jgi:hypothetical protein
MVEQLARRTRRHRWPWSGFGLIVLSSVVTIGLLVIVVLHRDAQLPKATSCPGAPLVNGTLETHVAAPSAVSESDLLGCFYREGSDGRAVSVSFGARRRSDDPCRTRRRFTVSGDGACDVTGSPGTETSGASLVVEARGLQDQFSTDLGSVSLDRLEKLAARVLAENPPPVHDSTRTVQPAGAVSQA